MDQGVIVVMGYVKGRCVPRILDVPTLIRVGGHQVRGQVIQRRRVCRDLRHVKENGHALDSARISVDDVLSQRLWGSGRLSRDAGGHVPEGKSQVPVVSKGIVDLGAHLIDKVDEHGSTGICDQQTQLHAYAVQDVIEFLHEPKLLIKVRMGKEDSCGPLGLEVVEGEFEDPFQDTVVPQVVHFTGSEVLT